MLSIVVLPCMKLDWHCPVNFDINGFKQLAITFNSTLPSMLYSDMGRK